MVDIVLTKLGASTVTAVGATSATALDFLSAFLSDAGLKCVDLPTFLVRQVENALCESNLALFRPSCLALALLLSYKQNLPPVCVIDSESSAFKSLQNIDLRDLFTIANLGKVIKVLLWLTSFCAEWMVKLLLYNRLFGPTWRPVLGPFSRMELSKVTRQQGPQFLLRRWCGTCLGTPV